MFKEKILALAEKIEDSRRGVVFWFLLFYGTTMARTVTESLIGGLGRLPQPLTLFVHFPLFYFDFFMAIAFILCFFAGEKIQKTAKLVFSFCFLILLVPITDFLIFGSTFHYTYPMDLNAITMEFFVFGGLLPGSVLLPGQAVAIWGAIFLIAAYVFAKTNNALKALAAACSFYLAGVFFSAFPFFASRLFGLGNGFNPGAMMTGILFFLLFAFIECILWLNRYDKKLLAELSNGLRLARLTHYATLAFFGWLFGFLFVSGQTPNFLGLFLAIFSASTAFWASLFCNNLFDQKITGKKAKEYAAVIFSLSSFSLASAFFAGIEMFSIMFLALMLGIYYSVPPFRLKRLGFLNNIAIGLISMLVFIAGFLGQHSGFGTIPSNAILAVVITFSLAANVKDLKDYEADKQEGIWTLPVLLGKEKGLQATAALTSLSFLVPPLCLGILEMAIVAVPFGILNYALLKRKKSEKTAFALYFVFAAILAVRLFFNSS
jgi:4-hydroxybenzoate polyprenyltransferase